MKSVFAPKDVVDIVGVSYRQLQYWDKTSFIKPSCLLWGRRRFYTFNELVLLKLAKTMRDRKVSIQKLRKIIHSVQGLLEELNCPLADCCLLFEGDRIFIFSGEVFMDEDTLGRFMIFDVREFRREIERAYPEDEEAEAPLRRAALV